MANAVGQPAQPSSRSSRSSRSRSLCDLDREIADLQVRLRAAEERRHVLQEKSEETEDDEEKSRLDLRLRQQQQQQHFFMLLSDSALPLGSFAFSSGLESFLAHVKAQGGNGNNAAATFNSFLPLSVASYARTSLPFVLAAHDAALAAISAATDTSTSTPTDTLTETLVRLDDTYDATIVCTVGRRSSIAQGRALLSVWERAFASELGAGETLRPFSRLVKKSSLRPGLPVASAHLPPLFGAVAALAGLDRRQTADVYALAHAKALASAAVRASVMGPYQAQRLLASETTRQLLADAVTDAWDLDVEHAGQTAPVVDLWMGRHELLYSRIFNS